MRDRLIELIRQAKKSTKGANCDLEREMLFADHLLANGVIVPPCKVGDKVYFIDTCTTAEDFGKEYVNWGEVLQLTFNYFGEWVILTDRRLLDKGKVFLTKEEAEEKLKECEGQ